MTVSFPPHREVIAACFSGDRIHRYTWRMVLDPEDQNPHRILPRVLFVMLNPSTADELRRRGHSYLSGRGRA